MIGWIKLHRQFRESPYYKEPNAKAVWIECLLRATHVDDTVFLKRQKVFLKAGEFCMGREEFGAAIGISGSTAWYWLLQFEVDSMVDIKKTTKGSVVSVKNWLQYQLVDSTIDNRKTTDEQQMNTNKNVKKVKNDKEVKKYVVRPETEQLLKTINDLCQQYVVRSEISPRGLDMLVEKYIGKVQMKVEVQHALVWLVSNNEKTGKNRACSTSFIGNWFKKKIEINKRDELKTLEWKQSLKDPQVAASLKKRGEEKPAHIENEIFTIDPNVKARLGI